MLKTGLFRTVDPMTKIVTNNSYNSKLHLKVV